MEGPDQIFDASAYVTSDINGKVKLRLDENTKEYPPMSLPSMLTKAAEESPDQIVLILNRILRSGSTQQQKSMKTIAGKLFQKITSEFPLKYKEMKSFIPMNQSSRGKIRYVVVMHRFC